MEGYLIGALAGPAASKKWNPNLYLRPSIRDRRQVWDQIKDRPDRDAYIEYLEMRAAECVEKHWRVI
jgi:hypothetical protein